MDMWSELLSRGWGQLCVPLRCQQGANLACVCFLPPVSQSTSNRNVGNPASVIKVANKTTQLSGSTGYAAAALSTHIYKLI